MKDITLKDTKYYMRMKTVKKNQWSCISEENRIKKEKIGIDSAMKIFPQRMSDSINQSMNDEGV